MKQQIFIDDIHEYDYELVDNNRHTFYYSNGEQWNNSIQEHVSIQVIDTGNDLRVAFENNKFSLDYAEAERLFILLKLVIQQSKYEIAQKKLL